MSSKVSSRQGAWQGRKLVDAAKKTGEKTGATSGPTPPAHVPVAPRTGIRVSPRVASRQGAWKGHLQGATDAGKVKVLPAAPAPPLALPAPAPAPAPLLLAVAPAPVADDASFDQRVNEEVERRLAEQVAPKAPARPSRIVGRFGVKPAGE